MQMLQGIVTNTPIWVWAVLAGLVVLGLRRTQTRETSPIGIIIPASLFGLVAITRLALGHFAGPAVLGTVAGIIAALIILIVVRPGNGVTRLETGTLRVPGEWFSLGLILLVFSANYVIAVLSAISPAVAMSDDARFAYGFINALSASFMIGRAAHYLKAAKV